MDGDRLLLSGGFGDDVTAVNESVPWSSRDEIRRSTVEISCPAPREPPVYPAQPCPCWLGKQEVHCTGSVGWHLLKDFIHIPQPSSLQAQVHLAERMGRAWPHPSLAPGSFIPSTPKKKKKRKLKSKKNALEAFYPKYLHYQNVAHWSVCLVTATHSGALRQVPVGAPGSADPRSFPPQAAVRLPAQHLRRVLRPLLPGLQPVPVEACHCRQRKRMPA